MIRANSHYLCAMARPTHRPLHSMVALKVSSLRDTAVSLGARLIKNDADDSLGS